MLVFSQCNPACPLVLDYPHTSMNKDSIRVCLCVGPCIVWRGNMSPTSDQILENPNLLGINQSTCSESNLCQRLTLCTQWFPGCRPLCFPTSVISVIWNQFNNCARDWFEYANSYMGRKRVSIKKTRVGQKRPSWEDLLCITLTLKSNNPSSVVLQTEHTHKKKIWTQHINKRLTCAKTVFEEEKGKKKNYTKTRKTRSERGQEWKREGGEGGTRKRKQMNKFMGQTWRERWRGAEKGLGVISGRFLLPGQWRRTQKHREDSIKYHMQWPYCHGYRTVKNINQACAYDKEKWDGGRRRTTAVRQTEGEGVMAQPLCVWFDAF